MATTRPIRNKHQVRELADYYLTKGQLRNHVLIVLGVHTALRISDLLRLRWEDVYDFETGLVKTSMDIIEKKTKKSKTVAINKAVMSSLSMLAVHNAGKGRFLIENRNTGKAISRIQAYRLIRTAAEALHFAHRTSCHSLRKTFGYHAWKAGKPLAVIMEIYNHTSIAVTLRYLGVSQDDKDEVYLSMDFTDSKCVSGF